MSKYNIFVPNVETMLQVQNQLASKEGANHDYNIVVLEHVDAMKLVNRMREYGRIDVVAFTDSTYMMPAVDTFVDDGKKRLPETIRDQYKHHLIGKTYKTKKGGCTVTCIAVDAEHMQVVEALDPTGVPVQIPTIGNQYSWNAAFQLSFSELGKLGKTTSPSVHLNIWTTVQDESGAKLDNVIRSYAHVDGLTMPPKKK